MGKVKFEGFDSPNYTQVPNEFLDYVISPDCDLTLVDIRIMTLFLRNTFGWQRSEYGLIFSLTDLQAILNIKNRNQVSDSLKKLVEKNFIEKKQVKALKKKERLNIEKVLERKLKSNQFIYRLKLKDNPLGWDIVVNTEAQMGKDEMIERKENFKKTTSNKNDTSIKNDTGTSIKNDTSNGIKNDTSEKAESVDTQGLNVSLKKSLNKSLNKKEEEEGQQSDLVKFLCSNGINEKDALTFEKRLIQDGKVNTSFSDCLEAIRLSEIDFENGVCDKPYIWAVGKIDIVQKRKSTPHRKTDVRTKNSNDIVPDWYKEGKHIENPEKAEADEMTEEQKKVAELLKQYAESDKPKYDFSKRRITANDVGLE